MEEEEKMACFVLERLIESQSNSYGDPVVVHVAGFHYPH